MDFKETPSFQFFHTGMHFVGLGIVKLIVLFELFCFDLEIVLSKVRQFISECSSSSLVPACLRVVKLLFKFKAVIIFFMNSFSVQTNV